MSADESPPGTGRRLAEQLLDPGDLAFLEALTGAGRLAELDDQEMVRIASEVGDAESAEARRVDLLEMYYAAAGANEDAKRRIEADRFFVQKVGEPATAAGLVERLARLAPEIGQAALTRIGGGDDGPLVVQTGEHFAAVLDDYDEETDTDQYSIKEAEQRRSDVPMVTVRGLVRAVNVLLEKADVRERLIGIRSDAEREVYVSLGLSDALTFADQDFLEDDSRQDVMALGAW
ncbi:MAG: hypothetical protein AB8I08_03735 [Sandaracinaceae bacterium]